MVIDEEVFKPIPGYEDLYAISRYGQIKHIRFNRFKKSTISKRGQEIVVLFKNSEPTSYTVSSLIKLAWNGIPIRINPSTAHCKKIKCEETDQIFDSYKECSRELNLEYRKMCKAIHNNEEYKGYHFVKID